MTQTNQKSRKAEKQRGFQVSPVAAGCAVLLISVASATHAQQASTEVVVTGIRAAIESAIGVKKESTSIVEAISAEDIGKLPDQSIAESIARLPGVSAQRVAGRASNISIRGMSGEFSTALLNGREQVSTADNRGVEYDIYPSELMGGVVIYKTPDSALLGQGLAGTVDLQTVRPLNYNKLVVTGNVRTEKSGIGTDFTGDGKRANFSLITQNSAKTAGIALGYSRQTSNVTTSRSETYDNNKDTEQSWDAPNALVRNGNTVGARSAMPAGSTPFTHTQGFKYFNDTTTQTREGVMAVVELKPNSNLHSTVDLFYANRESETVKRGLEIQVNDTWRGASNPKYPGVTGAQFDSNNKLVSGTWQNVNPLSRTIWEPREDTLKSVGWNNKLKIDKDWTAIADLSYSNAVRKERITEMEAGNPTLSSVTVGNYKNVTGISYDTGSPSIVKLMDPEGWGQNGYDKVFKTDDTINAVRLEGQRKLGGVISRVDFGLNMSNREKTKTADENKLILTSGVGSNMALPTGTTSVGIGGTSFNTVSFDPAAAFNSAYRLDVNNHTDVLLKSWSISEKINTLYSKAHVDTEIGGKQARGNFGVQVINTDQSSTALSQFNNQSTGSVTEGKTFTDVLPSANLAVDLADDQVLRFGLARVMARPRMDQLSVARRANVSSGLWSGGGGNPQLDPFRADAVDVSYEKYFGKKAYFGAAGFYKKLNSYIYDQTDSKYNFASHGFTAPAGTPVSSPIGNFTTPMNGSGGSIQGVELAGSVPLNMFAPVLDGFGLVASYANTQSAIKPFGAGSDMPLPGLSRVVTNLTAYYEKNGFSLRASQRARSNFLGEVIGFGGGREYTYIKAEKIVDLQAGYEFQSGPAKGLSLLAQVYNANNAAYQRYQGTPDNVIDTVRYGKTVLLGATYKY